MSSCGVVQFQPLSTEAHLRHFGYIENRIHDEVSLWGTVVEHEHGWRAQFAYPKTLVVPLSIVPLGMNSLELWLASLSAYGCDISVDNKTGLLALWRRDSGVVAAGIALLMQRCNAWYARRAEERRIKRGDRLAMLGHGIAIVEHADNDFLQAILGKRNVLRIERNEIVWCERHTRWETLASTSIGTRACRT